MPVTMPTAKETAAAKRRYKLPLTVEQLEVGKVYHFRGRDTGDLFFSQDCKLVRIIGLGSKARPDQVFDVVEVQRMPLPGVLDSRRRLGRVVQVHASDLVPTEIAYAEDKG